MFIWFSFMTLMLEASRVIEMRLRLISLGKSTSDDMFLTATEKLNALDEAKMIIVRGGDPSQVIDHCRKIVSANVVRLSAGSRKFQKKSRRRIALPASTALPFIFLKPSYFLYGGLSVKQYRVLRPQ
jgi:hypothetical protein